MLGVCSLCAVHEQTLFRTDSVATKFVGASMHHYGGDYLHRVVRPLLEDVFRDGLDYEVIYIVLSVFFRRN